MPDPEPWFGCGAAAEPQDPIVGITCDVEAGLAPTSLPTPSARAVDKPTGATTASVQFSAVVDGLGVVFQ